MTGNEPTPESGDLLVARPTASKEYDLTIVPTSKVVIRDRFGRAIAAGLDLAQELSVDLWLTEDHIHYLRLAAHRGSRTHSGELRATD